jgi:hypothetical protein
MTASMADSTASIKAKLFWEPPAAMRAVFSSLQPRYEYEQAASAVASGLQVTFPLPNPVGDLCLRFANGAITRCPTSSGDVPSAASLASESTAELEEEEEAEPKLFATDPNHDAVLAERVSKMEPGDFVVVYE